MKTTLRILLLFCSTAALTGCSSFNPSFNGLFARNGAAAASAKLFEFDKPPAAARDITPYAARDYGFSLTNVKEGTETCLVAHNRRELPVSVYINLTATENLVSDRSFPFYHVVPPESDLCIVRFHPLDKNRDYKYRVSQTWMAGDYTARHKAPGGYLVPWEPGRSYAVAQAPGGPLTTHQDRFSRNAIDFSMPEGTPVMAARPGVVVGAEDSFTAGGLDPALMEKANYVDILQDDGTVADYAHLRQNSLAVRIGQRVAAGDKLALSGSTGYSSGPHLHFAVWTLESTDKGFERVSLPVEFCFDGTATCVSPEYRMNLSREGVRGVSGNL